MPRGSIRSATCRFLREFGTHLTVNRMLSFDSVRQRLDREQPLTLLEFNYMVLQAFDFLELSRRHGCVLQMGGLGPVGQHRQRIELARPASTAPALRPDDAADHDAGRRPRWARPPTARLAMTGRPESVRVVWQFLAHTETDVGGGSCACSRSAPLDEIVGRRLGGRSKCAAATEVSTSSPPGDARSCARAPKPPPNRSRRGRGPAALFVGGRVG
jgi:hypothetical protein